LTVENPSYDTPIVGFDVSVIYSTDGLLTVTPDNCEISLGLISSDLLMKHKDDILDMDHSEIASGIQQGGSFKSFFRPIGRFLKGVGKDLAPVAQKALVDKLTSGINGLSHLSGSGEMGNGLKLGNGMSSGRQRLRLM
jgi:hypothetical protein